MNKSVSIGWIVSGFLFANLGGLAEAGHHGYWKHAAAACPCVVMQGGCGARGVTTGYTIAPCRSCAISVGCHRWVRVCTLPGYTCATPWCFYGGGGYGCGACGGYCGAACGGACGTGGCSSCSDGAISGQTFTGEASEQELDGNSPQDAPGEPELAPSGEARSQRGWRYRLVSDSAQDGSAAFDKGLGAFRARLLGEALQDFEIAAGAEPDNSMYHYYRALTLFELRQADAAGEALRQAVELEGRTPIAQWGKRMERVQGRGRAWIERARREAGLTR